MDGNLKVHAEWSPDCGGKWDYDCGLVSLSCRYWPSGGGFLVVDSTGVHGNESRPEIKPSAKATICVGDLVNGPYEDIVSADFEADTEAEVKAGVEAWAQERFEEIVAILKNHYAPGDRHD